MSLRLPLKWAIFLVVILGVILNAPPLMQGDYSGAGSAFVRWAVISIAILLIALWDERSAKKDIKK